MVPETYGERAKTVTRSKNRYEIHQNGVPGRGYLLPPWPSESESYASKMKGPPSPWRYERPAQAQSNAHTTDVSLIRDIVGPGRVNVFGSAGGLSLRAAATPRDKRGVGKSSGAQHTRETRRDIRNIQDTRDTPGRDEGCVTLKDPLRREEDSLRRIHGLSTQPHTNTGLLSCPTSNHVYLAFRAQDETRDITPVKRSLQGVESISSLPQLPKQRFSALTGRIKAMKASGKAKIVAIRSSVNARISTLTEATKAQLEQNVLTPVRGLLSVARSAPSVPLALTRPVPPTGPVSEHEREQLGDKLQRAVRMQMLMDDLAVRVEKEAIRRKQAEAEQEADRARAEAKERAKEKQTIAARDLVLSGIMPSPVDLSRLVSTRESIFGLHTPKDLSSLTDETQDLQQRLTHVQQTSTALRQEKERLMRHLLAKEGWSQYSSPDGRPYYHHAATNKTQWSTPKLRVLKPPRLSGASSPLRALALSPGAPVAGDKAAAGDGEAMLSHNIDEEASSSLPHALGANEVQEMTRIFAPPPETAPEKEGGVGALSGEDDGGLEEWEVQAMREQQEQMKKEKTISSHLANEQPA